MTDHAGFLELAARRIDFDLTPVEAARLEAHLAACAPCRLKVERLRADSTALRSFGWYDAPAKVEDVVLTAALHGRGKGAPRPWAMGFAAALVLAVLAGGALGGGPILERLLVGARPTSPAPSLPASAEAPSVAPTAVLGGSPTPRPSAAAATSSKNMFVGNFEVIDFGTRAVIGRVTANLIEPTEAQLVVGTYDFTGAPGYEVLAGHGQLATGRFGYEPNAKPGVSGANFAEGAGVVCDYYAPNNATCREWQIQFIDFDKPGIPSQIDLFTRDAAGAWVYRTSYEVGRGSFVLTYAGG